MLENVRHSFVVSSDFPIWGSNRKGERMGPISSKVKAGAVSGGFVLLLVNAIDSYFPGAITPALQELLIYIVPIIAAYLKEERALYA